MVVVLIVHNLSLVQRIRSTINDHHLFNQYLKIPELDIVLYSRMAVFRYESRFVRFADFLSAEELSMSQRIFSFSILNSG